MAKASQWPEGRSPKGISLIEILVVLTIIGILASVIVPSIMSRPDEARVVAAKQDLAAISQGPNSCPRVKSLD